MNLRASGLQEWLAAMPKAELHLHLDGSLRPETALELARDRDVGLDTASLDVAAIRERLIAPERCLDQAELLRAFELPVALLQDSESLHRATGELVHDVASEGTRYAEIRWAPSLHTERGLSLRDVMATVTAAAARAAIDAGIEVRLIAVALRTHDPATATRVARTALDFIGDGLTGFDLAGIERDAPDPRRFGDAFALARQGGLGISCHAGEWGGPQQVRGALAIKPWRIAHGAPAADDAALCRELTALGVTLDICPTSNRQAGIGSNDHRAPLPRLIRAGVPVTVSTDDRTVSDLTLVKELLGVVTRLGVTPTEMEALTRHAYSVAFLHHDEALRSGLLEHFEDWSSQNPAPVGASG
ncbi:MAG: adenosine deaminase [Chloroflexota bacterium]